MSRHVPAYLQAMFVVRPPLKYLPPLDLKKKSTNVLTPISSFLDAFETTEPPAVRSDDVQHYYPQGKESVADHRLRIKREREEKCNELVNMQMAKCTVICSGNQHDDIGDPEKDPKIPDGSDPYKTLFVARMVGVRLDR